MMTRQHVLLRLVALGLLPLIAGCSGSGGGGGMSGVGSALSGISLGNIGGGGGGRGVNKVQLVQAGATLFSAASVAEDDQDDLGQAVAIGATNRWPLFDKPALTKYVTLVGLAVASQSSDPGGNWVFGVLDTPDVNAYSGPNGYILITRGAIAAMEDESELAGILAHEIAHVVNRDGLEAVKNAKVNEALMKGLSAADQRFAVFNQVSDKLIEKILTSGYSQQQETNADSTGEKLLIAAGYDPNGLVKFLKRAEQRKGTGGGKLFSTHPGTADRIAKISAQIGSAKPGATNKERFTKAAAEAKL
jgi:beta-barrel assembly-enhancing protease